MDFKSNETIYSQITEYLKKQIFCGCFASGARLPAIRDLAVLCRVNPNTIVRVYAQLTEEKLIYTDSTNGKFVTSDGAFILQKKREFLKQKAEAFAKEVREAGLDGKEAVRMLGEIFGGQEEKERT